MPNFRGLGREAEDLAAEYLMGKGYTIVTRRHKTRRGELDIVAMDGEVLVFVEVKFRQTPGYSPEEALSRSKIDALRVAIGLYLHEMEVDPPVVRLDLVAIDQKGIRHHKDLLAL
jgi:putative endonuclease